MPTIDEAGLKGYEVTIWNGFFAPKGMSKENIAKINQALVKTMADPRVVKRLTELAVDLPSKEEATPEALRHAAQGVDRQVGAGGPGRRRQAGVSSRACKRRGLKPAGVLFGLSGLSLQGAGMVVATCGGGDVARVFWSDC